MNSVYLFLFGFSIEFQDELPFFAAKPLLFSLLTFAMDRVAPQRASKRVTFEARLLVRSARLGGLGTLMQT